MTPPPQDLIPTESNSPLNRPLPSLPSDPERGSSNGAGRVGLRQGSALVREDLLRFGPQHCPVQSILPPEIASRQLRPLCTLEEAESYCRHLVGAHYENFSVVSRLLPKPLRQDVANIYAYCRWSDDLADEMDSPQQSQFLLDWWGGLLDDCFRGDAIHPVYVALRTTIEKHGLVRKPFEDLIHAFVQDQTQTRYDSDEELDRYCAGSANPVGRLLLALANVRDPESERASDAICTGLQLANFCQDMRMDAMRGRIYFPRQRWARQGVTEQEILNGNVSSRLRRAVQDWCFFAEGKLVEGLPLVKRVPYWLARNVQLFVRGGLSILHAIEDAQFDVWSREIEVRRSTKIGLLVRGWLQPRSTSAKRLRGA
ncbi:squalene synthase HpnC [Pirellula sp. SH-Sr6A]|uniref:squalene synthase HpnC n=1 Tax=Pirellula sp. SH-Sr6A TaxID=1632865 RepID=UPI000ACBB6C6|nr:squalene synthase HpnC [Pirellula sp. SH-Sr6A]